MPSQCSAHPLDSTQAPGTYHYSLISQLRTQAPTLPHSLEGTRVSARSTRGPRGVVPGSLQPTCPRYAGTVLACPCRKPST